MRVVIIKCNENKIVEIRGMFTVKKSNIIKENIGNVVEITKHLHLPFLVFKGNIVIEEYEFEIV